MTLLIFVATMMCSCAFLYVSWKLYTSKLSAFSGPLSLPLFGSVLILESEPWKLPIQFLGFFKKYGDTFILWLGHVPLIFTSQIEYVEAILSSKDILKKSSFYWFFHEWLGTGLLTSYGMKWKQRRRILTPSFHFTVLNNFTDIIMEHAETLVEHLRLHCDTDKAIDVQSPVSLAALDVICNTAMGVKINAQKCTSSQYAKSVHSMNAHLQLRQKYPWLWPKFIYKHTSSGKRYYKDLKVLHDFTVGVINKRIESRKLDELDEGEEHSPRRKAFLDMLLDLYDKGEIDIGGIREEVDTFMFEGHDTTAAGISWVLYLLGTHPEVQNKLHAEIDSISKSDRDLATKILELKYLEYVVKEGLRLHPPVGIFARTLENDTIIDGKLIPKGTEIVVAPAVLHRNEKYWENPEEFYPDRFGEDNFFKRRPYCYVPFSAGSRNCVGQKFAMREEKILLFHIMSNFRLVSVQEEDEIENCFEIIHRSNNGLMIKFYSRNM